ncbi:MAG: MoaD/ThiS family protein [Acidimicrobiia bacterium]|jgi:MoaD family protein
MTVRLLLFASAREAAGLREDTFEVASASTVDGLLAAAGARYGPQFATVLGSSRIWVNADEPPSGGATALHDGDEVAVLPPVSGGA